MKELWLQVFFHEGAGAGTVAGGFVRADLWDLGVYREDRLVGSQ